jgi:hypothetical protein
VAYQRRPNNALRIGLVAALLVAAFSVSAATSPKPGQQAAPTAGTAPSRPQPWQSPDFWTQEAKPLTVTVDRDPEQAGADSIGPKGGTVSLETDTATYQLVVPAGALLSETRIRMQELRASSGPTNGKFAGGLQFEPEGLEFADAATLKITLKTPLNRRGIGLVWLYDGKGDDAHLAPYKIEGSTISRPIAHFSGMVVRNPWTKEEIGRFGLEVEGPQRTPFDRLQHQAGKVVADNRSCALRPPTDGCPDDANAVLQSLFDGYRLSSRNAGRR